MSCRPATTRAFVACLASFALSVPRVSAGSIDTDSIQRP